MGLKERAQIKNIQKLKRRKKRVRLQKKELNPDNYYYGGFYVGVTKERQRGGRKDGREEEKKDMA